MEEEKIYRLAYVSTACDCLKLDDINNILDSSKVNNQAENITGILIYCNKHFFQILEGDENAVKELYEKIAIDCRHDNVIKIQEGEVEKRNFGNWSMAFKSYNKELKYLDNFNNEQFYSYIYSQLQDQSEDVSLKILADFFDLNG
jgi:hypothetical protein